jgi:hypothetical protein
MTNPPRIFISLDLQDGFPPIRCNNLQEAGFLRDVWLASQGNFEALQRLRTQPFPKLELGE